MPDENQAMIEALKRDRVFVIVTEWKSKVDVSTGAPVIEKEQIRRGVGFLCRQDGFIAQSESVEAARSINRETLVR